MPKDRPLEYQVVRVREPASFWREKMVVVRIIITGFSEKVAVAENRICNQRLEVLSFCERPGEGLTSFN